MLLHEIFSERAIKLNLEADTKEAVFRELVETLADVYPQLNKPNMLSAIQDRERKMSTAVASGIAVPHGYYSGINRIFGAIGISKNGIEYNALDNEPVHFVFLLLMGKSVCEEHLRTLNRLLSLIHSGALASMRTAETAREVNGILSCFH
jgi:mannitol/fructose-specific phosphotransferase system IIA component (Ntr-type)